MTASCYLIVGAGQAGGWAAKTLRQQNANARIVLIGDEPHPPHERPPLSKELLLNLKPPEATYIVSADKLATLNIERHHARVESIDCSRKCVIVDETRYLYHRLLLATGSRVRRLHIPGASLSGIHYLRTIEDSIGLRDELRKDAHVLIVGGGWIGLEVASAARKRGARVTVVESSERLCSRVLPPGELESYLLDLHQRRGVEVRLKTGVVSFEGGSRVERAVLSTGERIPVSAVVVGIGVVPNVELAKDAGLRTDDGIIVDQYGRTSDPDVFAAGDCANQPSQLIGRRVRLESWSNAQNQSIAAAKAMLGNNSAYDEIPWFWSDQHDANVQLLGFIDRSQRVVTRRHKLDGFVQFYMADEKIVGAAAVNSAQDIQLAKRLMKSKTTISPEILADEKVDLRNLFRSAQHS